MKTSLICLANSYKEGGRCVAGIKCHQGEVLWNENNKPFWVRPVSRMTPHGEIDSLETYKFKLLDIVGFDFVEPIPHGHQVENLVYMPASFKITGTFEISGLDELCDQQQPFLFGSKSKAVTEVEASVLMESLTLIQVSEFQVYEKKYQEVREKPAVRLQFTFNQCIYDLPITDPVFLQEYRFDKNFLKDKKLLYLCLSLGVMYEGLHYKLVAGILPG